MKINLNIEDFIRRNIPVHMLQPNRLDVYWFIMREIDKVWTEYAAFRDIKDIEKNITHSKKSLEWWLNRQLFGDGYATKLEIVFGAGNTYYVALENRDTGDLDHVVLSTEAGSDNMELSRRSDDFGSIDTDFAIESKLTLSEEQKEQINLIVEQFRTAGTDYQIIEP